MIVEGIFSSDTNKPTLSEITLGERYLVTFFRSVGSRLALVGGELMTSRITFTYSLRHHLQRTYNIFTTITKFTVINRSRRRNPSKQHIHHSSSCLGESQQQCPRRPAGRFGQLPDRTWHRPSAQQLPQYRLSEGGSTTRKISRSFVRLQYAVMVAMNEKVLDIYLIIAP